MKVILLQDVARVGRRGEVAKVPDGHARNFLIPRGMAEDATVGNLKKLETQRATLEAKQAANDEAFAATCEKLHGMTLEMPMQANEQGSLFKGVKATDIAERVAKEVGPIGMERIELDTPIKETGEYPIRVALNEGECLFTLKVTAQE